MGTDFWRNLFVSLLVEFLVALLAVLTRGNKNFRVLILGAGTLLAGLVGFGPQLLQSSLLPETASPNGALSPEAFIRGYYQALNDRQYDKTWSLLSEDFKQNMHSPEKGGYQGYVDWCDTIEKIEVIEVIVNFQKESTAQVFVKANYRYQNGKSGVSQRSFNLIMDSARNTWIFDW